MKTAVCFRHCSQVPSLFVANTPDEGGGEGGDAGGGGGDEDKRKYLETLKAERDYKRRRQTYRAKNVRITKRTPVEVSMHSTKPYSQASKSGLGNATIIGVCGV